jgi:hypothetical protein
VLVELSVIEQRYQAVLAVIPRWCSDVECPTRGSAPRTPQRHNDKAEGRIEPFPGAAALGMDIPAWAWYPSPSANGGQGWSDPGENVQRNDAYRSRCCYLPS